MPLAAAGIGAGGSLIGGLLGSHAASQAAQAQAQTAQQALDFSKQQWATTQRQEQPFLQAGQGAIGNLANLTQPGGALVAPWTQQFQAPTGATEQNDPGYQFRLQQGMQALQRSAAAQGNLLTGGTAKDLMNYAQNYASNEYGNVYNRALTQYGLAYNAFQANQANAYNRMMGVAGIGEDAASRLGQFGLGTSANVGNMLGQLGAARASGYMGPANAWAGAIGGAANQFGQGIMLNSLLGSQSNPSWPTVLPPSPGAYTPTMGSLAMPTSGPFGQTLPLPEYS